MSSHLTTTSSQKTGNNPTPGSWSSSSQGVKVHILTPTSQSNTLDGSSPASNQDPGTHRESVAESTLPLGSSQLSVHGSSVTSLPSTFQETVAASDPPSVYSTPRGSLQESPATLMPGYPWVLVPGLPISNNPSQMSIQAPPTPNNSPQGSVHGSVTPSFAGYPWLPIPVPRTLYIPSQMSVQRPPTTNNTSQISMPASAPPSVFNGHRNSLQIPPVPNNTPRVSTQETAQFSAPGSLLVSLEGSAPPPGAPVVSARESAPPSVPYPWVSLERLAPPPDAGLEGVKGSTWSLAVPTLISTPLPPESINRSMASPEKASTAGHMFDVVVIGGGISGQCGP